jgi:phosphate transport system substrate-binding protein
VLERRGGEAHETRVALDALAVYVQADSPIQSLTIAQLGQIFRGQVTNWNQVGGPDHEIVLYSRENNSGTYASFKEHVLDDMDFAANAQTLPGTAAVINAISRDPFGIGYGGIAYAEGVRAIRVAAEGAEPVEPTMENATRGIYPLSRYLFVYTAGEPSGIAQAYIEYVLSEAGQSIVEGVGYYPLPSADAAAPAEATAPADEAPADEAPADEAPAAEAPAADAAE